MPLQNIALFVLLTLVAYAMLKITSKIDEEMEALDRKERIENELFESLKRNIIKWWFFFQKEGRNYEYGTISKTLNISRVKEEDGSIFKY